MTMLLMLVTSVFIHLTSATDGQCSHYYYINNLLAKLAPSEIKSSNVEKKCTALQEQNELFSTILKTLSQTVDQLVESDKVQQVVIMEMREENEKLKKTLEDQTIDVQDSQKKLNLIENKTSAIERIEKDVSSMINAGCSEKSAVVLAELPRQSLRSNKIAKFSTIVYNIGDAYNTKTGIFKTPSKGTYIFSVNLCMDADSFVSAAIMRGTVVVSKFRAGADGWASCSSDTVVIQLNAGEKISVKISLVNYGRIASTSFGVSSFSGALVNA